jgi:predicted Rossmann fold nucleotide-binding protein DprA/Smf involved in DNA uptake
MNLSPETQATLLLTISFSHKGSDGLKPLSKTEWARLSSWLKENNLNPSDLLDGSVNSLTSHMFDKTISAERIQSLLNRGTALGIALEKWGRAGIWILNQADPEYPDRIKSRLETKSPPILFGCGNKKLLQKGGIAIVGSRDTGPSDLRFTYDLGKEIALQGHSVISGGARGVDQTAMTGTLENDGTGVVVLADGLLRAALAAQYRNKIMSGDLVLVSPFNPEVGFNVGLAMARNSYIYCLSDAAVVVCSTVGKGGTWAGATENLKAGWVPLWTKPNSVPNSGNHELVSRGARWFPGENFDVESLVLSKIDVEIRKSQPVVLTENTLTPSHKTTDPINTPPPPTLTGFSSQNLFELFVILVQEALKDSALTPEEIAEQLGLHKAQANLWLNQALKEQKIKKLFRPVKFEKIKVTPKQDSLFD